MLIGKLEKKIQVLCEQVFPGANIDYDSVTRMGGLTNLNYRMKINEEEYAIRFPGEGTQQMINRKNEFASTKLAYELGIEPEILYFNQEDGTKIERYIEHAVTMSPNSMKQKENLKKVAYLFRTLHQSNWDTGVNFDVFKMIEEYERLIQESKISLYPDYDDLKAKINSYQEEVVALHIQKVPCHNDPLCENFVRSKERMYLIDWEYAGMNDPLWDLADISIEASLSNEEEAFLLREYLGKEGDALVLRRLLMNKAFLDFLWMLWGKARSFYDPELEEYAMLRYRRTKANMALLEELG